jgi:hypothetical protein
MSANIKSENRRLLESLEFIDEKLILEALGDLRLPTSEDPTVAAKSPFKHWKSLAALAACILLLSIASPLVSYIAEVISNFNAGAGSGTTMENTSDYFDTSNDYLEISDTENKITNEMSDNETTDSSDINYTTQQETSVIKEEIPDAEPEYWKFIPDLEPLSEEEMLTIQSLYRDLLYNEYFENSYKKFIKKGYSDTEAAKHAAEKAQQSLLETKDNFFHYWYYQQRGYLGKFADYAILWRHKAFDDVVGTIGGFEIGFDKFYAYKDGKLYLLQEIYNSGEINDDDLLLILNREKEYQYSLGDYWPDEYQKQKESTN